MKKKELMDFIDIVQRKAVKSVAERHDKIINDAKEKLFEDGGFNKRIEAIQKKINSLQEETKNLAIDMNENRSIHYPMHRSYDILHKLNDFIGNGKIKSQTLSFSDFDGGEIPLLEKAKDKEIEEVELNYRKVKYVSQQKTSAKDIAEYLEAIGFDISSVKKGDDCVALSVELDKSKLFVCGENK